MPETDADLRGVVRRAAMLLPATVAVVERCRTDPDPGQDLARACGALVSQFGRLRDELAAVAPSPLVERVDIVLGFEQRVLVEAGRLAFRPHGDRWSRVAARFGDGLGESSDELLQLAAAL